VARTLAQIEASLASSIEQQDSSIDTVKGPVFDLLIRPYSAQLRSVELKYDDLSRRFSLDYVLTQSSDVLVLYGANHGLRPDAGRPSTGNVVFFTSSAISSSDVTVIPAGTVVTTSDPSIAYRTVRDAFIFGSSLPAFFNAARRRYEVKVPVEALGSGSIFEVPARRVNNILVDVPGIDGVINFERISGGTERESNSRFGRRIRSKFNGLGQGSGSGLEQLIRNYDPGSIQDVVLIFSTDYDNFRRRTRRSAWDVYLIGSKAETADISYISDGLTQRFSIPNTPVLSVSSVLVDGSSVDYTFIPDTSDGFRGSTRANDQVSLSSIPGLNSTVTITYQYDRLVRDTQDYVDRVGVKLYRADILVRKAIPVEVRSRILVQVLSSFDETDAASFAYATTAEFLNPEQFVSLLFPNDLRSKLTSTVAGVASITVTEFTRNSGGTIPVEVIEFKPYEYPVSDSSLTQIDVRR
tara:strand:- start:2897 stop:4297 length:1401 start_codon:yes stop_codon:yes gene_type:complete